MNDPLDRRADLFDSGSDRIRLETKRMTLHLTYRSDPLILQRLDRWDAAIRRDTAAALAGWRTRVVWEAARDANISGSTGIEGNPLTPEQVDQVLSGAAIDADEVHIREVLNYNRALRIGTEAVGRADFEWTGEIIHQVNRAVMDGLPRDTLGGYRGGDDEVYVGIYTGPSPLVVEPLMAELVAWLRSSRGVSTLVRSALLHLNLIAIHPFNDGNGRTARLLAAMALMEDGSPASELISTEAYLRRHRDEYVAVLRSTLGHSYDPENHPFTYWLDFSRDRLLDALPGDIGVVVDALLQAGDPLEWAQLLLMARLSRLRTEQIATMTGRSAPAARALLAAIATRGWLEPQGRTRGRWFAPSSRLLALNLRVPVLMRHLADGGQLELFE
jgi:Fic family protein